MTDPASDADLRVAVVGLGNAGYTLHLPALAGMSDVTVVGACDLTAERRERAAERERTARRS